MAGPADPFSTSRSKIHAAIRRKQFLTGAAVIAAIAVVGLNGVTAYHVVTAAPVPEFAPVYIATDGGYDARPIDYSTMRSVPDVYLENHVGSCIRAFRQRPASLADFTIDVEPCMALTEGEARSKLISQMKETPPEDYIGLGYRTYVRGMNVEQEEPGLYFATWTEEQTVNEAAIGETHVCTQKWDAQVRTEDVDARSQADIRRFPFGLKITDLRFREIQSCRTSVKREAIEMIESMR